MARIQYFWRHPLAEQVREEGREEGRAEARVQERAALILRTLQWRQIDVPAQVRDRVHACTDIDELDTWLDRCHQVTDAWGLFADGS